MKNGSRIRGRTKRCTSCGLSFVYATLDGVLLVNGTECAKCEASSIVERLWKRIR